MASRLDLQSKLEELLGTGNVYYQPPESIKMNYTAIRFSKKKPNVKFANNAKYLKMNCYEIIVISRRADDPVNDKISELPYCEWDRSYTADNLEHNVYTLYY